MSNSDNQEIADKKLVNIVSKIIALKAADNSNNNIDDLVTILRKYGYLEWFEIDDREPRSLNDLKDTHQRNIVVQP